MGATGGQEDRRDHQHAGDARHAGGRVRRCVIPRMGEQRGHSQGPQGGPQVRDAVAGHRQAANREDGGQKPKRECNRVT